MTGERDLKEKYGAYRVWCLIKDKILSGFPPERNKILTYICIYGENFVSEEEYSDYILETYNLFRDEILSADFITLLEYAALVAGSGSDRFMQVLYKWGKDTRSLFKHIPEDVENTVYDFTFVCNLIEEALLKIKMEEENFEA